MRSTPAATSSVSRPSGTTASVVSIDRDAYALDRIGGRARRQRPGPLN
jgi:hypothetical protein